MGVGFINKGEVTFTEGYVFVHSCTKNEPTGASLNLYLAKLGLPSAALKKQGRMLL